MTTSSHAVLDRVWTDNSYYGVGLTVSVGSGVCVGKSADAGEGVSVSINNSVGVEINVSEGVLVEELGIKPPVVDVSVGIRRGFPECTVSAIFNNSSRDMVSEYIVIFSPSIHHPALHG
jgi:hypothetical protein